MKQVPKEGGELKTKSFQHRRRWRNPFVWAVAAASTFLLYQLVATLIEELPALLKQLR